MLISMYAAPLGRPGSVKVPVTLNFDHARCVGFLVIDDPIAAELICGDNVILSPAWTTENGHRRVAVEVSIVRATSP